MSFPPVSGCRTFRFDPATGKAVLNGKPYFMRGTNICYHRFSEDTLRKNLPWDTAWVEGLYQEMKDCYMNSVRHCLGSPPGLWYDIADEKGILIQDEFPIWYGLSWPDSLEASALVPEFKKMMEDHWNHPSVVIWDAQNESWIDSTRKVIHEVREIDGSVRPWDNGYGMPDRQTDPRESHPYRFYRATYCEPPFHIEQLENETGQPDVPVLVRKEDGSLSFKPVFLDGTYPFIINEYGWLWLNRDGSVTPLTDKVYSSLLGEKSSAEERRITWARNLAGLTEFWRGNRKAAAIMHFCFLGYSRSSGPPGYTSDNFADVTSLTLDGNFRKYVVDAFCPVGIMIDKWDCSFRAGEKVRVPLVLINDLSEPWSGTVSCYVNKGPEAKSMDINLRPYERKEVVIETVMPERRGTYLLTGELVYKGDTISSLRDLFVK